MRGAAHLRPGGVVRDHSGAHASEPFSLPPLLSHHPPLQDCAFSREKLKALFINQQRQRIETRLSGLGFSTVKMNPRGKVQGEGQIVGEIESASQSQPFLSAL